MLHNNTFHRISEFLVGLLFGLGLMLSGMTDPGKVIGFLDLFGAWDPSLALVMGGAIAVGFFAFGVAKKTHHQFLWRHVALSEQQPDRPTLGDWQFAVWRGLGLGWFLPRPSVGVHGRWPAQGLDFCCCHAGGHAGL